MDCGPVDYPLIPIQPDPRLSNLRPGWLADDTDWRTHLDAMTGRDVEFFERQWELAGGRGPAVDTSWITFDRIR